MSSIGRQSGAIAIRSENFYFNTYRLLAKAGFYWGQERYSFGITVTTPSFHLFNTSGWIATNRSFVVADTASPVISVEAARAEDLSSNYRSPISVAVGGAFHFGSTAIHVGAEWFASLSEYTVLSAGGDDFESTNQVPPSSITEKRNSVVNMGIGVVHEIGPVLSLHGAVTTDHSYQEPEPGSSLGITDFDIIRLSGGIALSIPQMDITAGMSYGFGKDNSKLESQLLVAGLTQGPSIPYRVTLHQMVVLVGLTLKL